MKFSQKPTHSALHRGMTLLEIVIVLGIIGLILGAAISNFGGFWGNAETKTAEIKIQGIRSMLESYRLSAGMYPTESQGLQALVTKPTSAPEPKRWNQLTPSLPLDPWQNEFIYKRPATKGNAAYEIISKGNDGILGTDDDVSSSQE